MLEKCRARKVTNQQADKIETVANKRTHTDRVKANETSWFDYGTGDQKYGARSFLWWMQYCCRPNWWVFNISRSILLISPFLFRFLLAGCWWSWCRSFLSLLLLISSTSVIVSTIHGNVSYSQNFFSMMIWNFIPTITWFWIQQIDCHAAHRTAVLACLQFTQNTVEI